MESESKTSIDTPDDGAPDNGVPQGLEKIAASIELLRLEMQGIRIVLEALVAKG